MKKKNDNVDSLLAAIQRQTPKTRVEAQGSSGPSEHDYPAEKGTLRTPPSQALRVQVYMKEEDRRTIRELAAWLAGQGVRASDSLIIRAALQLTKTDSDLLSTYRHLAQMDRRYKQVG